MNRICKESWMVVLLFEKPGKEREQEEAPCRKNVESEGKDQKKKIEGKREKIIIAGQQRISFQEHRRCTTCLNAE